MIKIEFPIKIIISILYFIKGVSLLFKITHSMEIVFSNIFNKAFPTVYIGGRNTKENEIYTYIFLKRALYTPLFRLYI